MLLGKNAILDKGFAFLQRFSKIG